MLKQNLSDNGGGIEMVKTVKTSIEKMEGRIEERIGNGLATYAAVAARKRH